MLIRRITKLRENCLAEFDAHWKCLEMNNQVSFGLDLSGRIDDQRAVWVQERIRWRGETAEDEP